MVRLPSNTQRLVIVGRTGSGKTVAALWHLSKSDFENMPWIVIDFKYDENINSIDRAEVLELGDKIPSRPGIYIVHPMPDQAEELDTFLWKIWSHENIGVFVDEGYMIGDSPAFRALLTQGRSKHIPMIVLSQRPVWLSRFVFSEADFYQEFHLNDKRDKQTIKAFMPPYTGNRVPDYHSRYYDVGKDALVTLTPVPEASASLEAINNRLRGRKRVI